MLRVKAVSRASGKTRYSQNLVFAKTGKKTVVFKTKGLARGRYVVVLQYTANNGASGPVVVSSLRVR